LDSVAVFSEKINGALFSVCPMLLPSTINCTEAVFDETFASTEIVPETVTPDAGEVIEMVGGVADGLFATMEIAGLTVVRPAAFPATAVSVWLPLVRVIVFNEKLNGALDNAAPVFLPSTLNCTVVASADTLINTLILPETVTPEAGEVIEMVGAEGLPFLLLALVSPRHPVQKSTNAVTRPNPNLPFL
jgi:hypothetical protein